MSESPENLEKDICKLYLISPPTFDASEFSYLLHDVLSFSHVPVFQLRMKRLSEDGTYTAPANPDQLLKAAEILKPVCNQNGTSLIINDNVEIAKQVGAQGVHLGDEDISVKQAREILGKDFSIGASCYGSKDRAFTAGEQGADYVAFGAFYKTETKKPKGHPKTDLLEFWRDYANIPSVAIGGIKVNNAEPLVKAGADFVAVVTGVWDHPKGAIKSVMEFNDLFQKVAEESS